MSAVTGLATMKLLLTTSASANSASLFTASSSASLNFPSKSLCPPNPNFFYSASSRRTHSLRKPTIKVIHIVIFSHIYCVVAYLSEWLCGSKRRDQDNDAFEAEEDGVVCKFGSDEESPIRIPSTLVMSEQPKPVSDVDYLQKNHIYTSGASGTNAAVIRGALRAEKPELLTVILPQSLKKQPPESQELLEKVKNVIEKPYNDHLSLIEASRLCNMDIISQVQQVICFAFHDSRLLMETCEEAKSMRKIVTLFYLD
ncbi:hypothetical protein LINGRAHAP2_LOCUS7768 [Linum grandiflorum]